MGKVRTCCHEFWKQRIFSQASMRYISPGKKVFNRWANTLFNFSRPRDEAAHNKLIFLPVVVVLVINSMFIIVSNHRN